MLDQFTEISIIHKDFYADFENKYLDKILEKIELDNYYLVKIEGELNEDEEVTHNVSIGIAAAITAYARVQMSYFKNNPNFCIILY
jgi:hypothetical protein